MKRNLLANFAGTAVTGVVTIALVPVYVGYLGMEAYGLIGFYASVTVIVALLDFGLGVATNREFARDTTGRFERAAAFLRRSEILYWSIAVLTGAVLFFAASALSSSWLSGRELDRSFVTDAVRAMAVAVAVRFPFGLYSAALLGAHRHVVLNAIVVAAALARAGAALLVLLDHPDLRLLLLAETAIAALQTLATRVAATRGLPDRRETPPLPPGELKAAWSFGATFAFIGVLSGLVSQVDKLVVSKIVSLGEFGAYTLAVTIGAAVATAVAPLHATMFPRFTRLIAAAEYDDLTAVYHRATQIVAAILAPVSILCAVFSSELLFLWTGRADLGQVMRWPALLIVLGSAFYAATTLLYALQLANTWMWPTVVLNAIALALLIPGSMWSARRFGIIGPAATWFVVHSLVLAADAITTHRRLLPGQGARWLFRDVAPPVLVSLAITIAARLGWSVVRPDTRMAMAALLGVTAAISAAAAALTTRPARDLLGSLRAARRRELTSR